MKLKGNHVFKILLAIVIFAACRQSKGPGIPDIIVSGELSNAASTMIRLSELDLKAIKPIDSATLDEDGRFSFKINQGGSVFLLISTKPGQQIILVAAPGEKIHLEGNAHELINTTRITGSSATILMLDFDRYTQHNQRKADSLGQVFLNSRSDPGFALIRQHLDSAYSSIAEDQRRYSVQFIEKHPTSLASLIVLNRKFGPNPVFNEESDYNYFRKIDSGLMAANPGNKHVLNHHSRVEALVARHRQSIVTDSLLSPGMPAPDVRLKNAEGKAIALSSIKDKIVLVYFWAAMDASSRKFIRQLIPIYKLYKLRGFEIYGLALEPNRSLWLNAVKLDNPGGIQVNAGVSLNAIEAALFGVKNLPDAILIDRKGKILRRNISLEELRKKLPGLLNR